MSADNSTAIISLSRLFPVLIIASIGGIILGEYFLGRTFGVALSAGFFTILLIVFMLLSKRLALPKIPTLFFAGFVIWNIIATFFSADLTLSMWEDVRLLSTFFLFIIAFTVVTTYKNASGLIVGFVILGSILITYDLSTYILTGGLSSPSYLSGLFSWHNQMAGFLLFLIPLVLILFIYTKKTLYRLLLILPLGIALTAMLMTYSRGGWIILVVQTLLLILLFGKNTKRNVLMFFCGGVVLFLFAILFFPSVLEKLASIPREFTDSRTVSGNFRVSVWSTSLEMIQQFPYVGVGPGSYGETYSSFQHVPWLFARNAHNHFIQIAVETGVIGVVLFIAFLLSVFKSVKNKFSDIASPERILFVGILIAVTGSLLHSMIDYDFSTVSLFVIFIFFLAVLLGMVNKNITAVTISHTNRLLYLYLGVFLLFVTLLEISEDAYLTAKYQFSEKRTLLAKENLTKTILFNPFNGKAYALASEVLYRNGEFEKSRQYASLTTDLLPYENRQFSVLGAIAINEKKYDEAIKWYTKAVGLKPYSNPNLYLGLGYSYQDAGKLEQAEKILIKAKNNIFPLNQSYKDFQYIYFANGLTNNLAELYVLLANIKRELGQEQEAEKLVEILKKDLTPPSSSLQLSSPNMLE